APPPSARPPNPRWWQLSMRPSGSGNGGLQAANLKLGAPDDAHEHQAERVAEEVMRTPLDRPVRWNLASRGGSAMSSIQRACAGCEEEVQRRPASDAVAGDGEQLSSETAASIHAL